MNDGPVIAAGAAATKGARRVLVAAIQLATGCCRSEAGQVVGDTVWLGLLTKETIALYQAALEMAPAPPASCPRCLGPVRAGTSGICGPCRRERKTPLRVYDCPACGGWHLTSRPESRARVA